MTKKSKNKTTTKKQTVTAYLQSLSPNDRKVAKELIAIFKTVTGVSPRMWGTTIVGFGEYHYRYESGREGDFLATGFSIRKTGPTIYIMPGYNDYASILKKIGPYKIGKSCLYLKSLEQVHLPTLKKLIAAGLKDLAKRYPVKMK